MMKYLQYRYHSYPAHPYQNQNQLRSPQTEFKSSYSYSQGQRSASKGQGQGNNGSGNSYGNGNSQQHPGSGFKSPFLGSASKRTSQSQSPFTPGGLGGTGGQLSDRTPPLTQQSHSQSQGATPNTQIARQSVNRLQVSLRGRSLEGYYSILVMS